MALRDRVSVILQKEISNTHLKFVSITKVVLNDDYSHAKFIQVNGETKIIESGVTTHERIPGESSNGSRLGNNRSTNNESNKHNKEINETHAYFNEVYDALKENANVIEHLVKFGF